MAESSDDGIVVRHEQGVLSLTLDRPERKNALSRTMIHAMVAALEDAADDDSTRVVTLQANGDHFCSGVDLAESNRVEGRPRTGHLQRHMASAPHRLLRVLHELQLPVVAGVQGWCAGIGCTLALSADVVVAAPRARFWAPFVQRGFTPDSATTFLLPRLIGLPRAKQMVLRGRPVDAELALEWGMISEVADGDLDTAVSEVAREFSASATIAVGLARSLLHRNLECDLGEALQNEAITEELAVRSDDFKEGMRSFVEGREPEYRGW